MLLPLILALTLIIAFALLVQRFGELKRTYYIGVSFWSRWLPVVATGIFLATLSVNLLGEESGALSVASFFSTSELVAFFLCGPLFLTRIGNVLAATCVVYSIERLLVGHPDLSPTVGLYLFAASGTAVAVLGDKMPWLIANPSVIAHKLREILLIAVTIGCLAVVFTGIVKVHSFARWLGGPLGLSIPPAVALGALAALFIGWMSVALGFTRHITIPLLALPSLFVLAYVTDWPTYLLVIPFTICLSLSLATADRRLLNRRGGTGYGGTLAGSARV